MIKNAKRRRKRRGLIAVVRIFLGKSFGWFYAFFTMTKQLKRAVSPTRTATSFGSSSNLGNEAICNLAARLMMVPTDGLVAEH